MASPKRVEPQKRRDPKNRHIDASSNSWAAVRNRDPGKHYVLVSNAADDQGPDYYESMGYEVEVYGGANGVSLRGGRSTKELGSPIEMRGHTLMSCSLERKAEIDQYGADGDAGQELADEVEQRLSLNKGRGRDALRGLGVQGEEYISFEKDIEAPRPVMTI
jgi:hypothetical protein